MKNLLEIHKDHLTFDDKPFYLASGDMHYFRHFKSGWKRRLQLMKDFGLTAVQTYVPWNLHEPEEGQFCFEDNLDVSAFLQECADVGLKVIFRPSGYMCSEWDLGGLPYWLLAKDVDIRTSEEGFMKCMRNYYEVLAPKFIPYLSTNGGPIIAVAVENEYGSFADDNEYIRAIGDMMRELGVDVPMLTANGVEPFKMHPGSTADYWTGVDCHSLTEEAIENKYKYQADMPIYIGELWGGRSQQWGGHFLRQTPDDFSANYKKHLELGAYVNTYMFCGGSNFAFRNGALCGRYGADVPDAPNRYIPFATSYDVDAPVSEHGVPTEKYFKCKKALKEYLDKNFGEGVFGGNEATDPSFYPYESQRIENITMTKSADLLENVQNLATNIKKSGFPKTFTDMKQDYGFMLYTTFANHTDNQERILTISGLQDRAQIFVNGEYKGFMMRDRETPPVRFFIPEGGAKIDILVENMGRVNYGNAMLKEHKGICGNVKLELVMENGDIYPHNYTMKSNWTNISLPMKDLTSIDWSKEAQTDRPAFYEGTFSAKPGVDTFVDMKGWDKGVVWINGFNLGRYWKVGPVGTQYVPGDIIKEHNTITVLELHNPNETKTVTLSDKPSLDTIEKTTDLVVNLAG